MTPFSGSCRGSFVLVSTFSLMAPKAPKEQATAKGKKRARKEDEAEKEAVTNVKEEKDAKGLYPAVPPEELNKLNSRLNT